MAISDRDHLEFMQNTSRMLGEIKSGQESTLSFVKAVNENQKKTARDLQEHVVSPVAHGETVRRDVWSSIGKVLAVLTSVGLFALAIVKAFGGHGGAP